MLKWYFPMSALFNLFTSLIIGSFVLSKDWKAKANHGFFVWAFTIAFWSLGYFFWQISKSAQSALFWCRVLTAGSIWISPWFYYFIINLLGLKEKKYTIVFWVGVGTAVIFTIFNITTGFLVASTRPVLSIPFWPVPGPLYLPYLGMFLFYAAYPLVLLWREYKKSNKFRKGQTKWIFLGTLIGYAGGCTNYPQWYGIDILPLGNILVSAYPLLVGYAIIRYHAFEIDTVIHRTVLWIATSLWLVIPAYGLFAATHVWLKTLSPLWITVMALLFFYLFMWYYHFFQPKIDHLFRRRKYDYYEVLSDVGQELGAELDLHTIVSRLFKQLKEILYIRNGIFWVQRMEEPTYTKVDELGYENLTDRLPDLLKRDISVADNQGVLQWINVHQKALERERIEIDSSYAPIKSEALTFLNQNSLELLIPTLLKNRVNGLIGIGKKENLLSYTTKDVELLEKMGRQLGVTIDNALHHGDIVEKERLDEELKLGREIQMNLLPKQIPEVPNLLLEGLMIPAKEIGGDYYDFIALPDKNEIAVIIGDVSGKGVGAGLLMSMVKATINAFSQEGVPPKQILLRTNSFLCQHLEGQKFMTLLYLKWKSQSRSFTYSSAGHEHILIYRRGKMVGTGAVEAIPSGGFMLGMMPEIEEFLEERELMFNPGDKILLYTDGVTEAENQQGERFGLDRLQESFARHNQKKAGELMQSVKNEVYTFIGNHPQYDDISLVAMEVR